MAKNLQTYTNAKTDAGRDDTRTAIPQAAKPVITPFMEKVILPSRNRLKKSWQLSAIVIRQKVLMLSVRSPKTGLHSFRHLFCSLLINQCVDIVTVLGAMGHSTVSTMPNKISRLFAFFDLL